MKILGYILTAALAATLCSSTLSAQNVVNDWNSIASTTIVTNAKEPSGTSGVWFAYVQLAVYDAVNAIDHQFQPYVFTTQAPAGASKDAAAVAAAHRILVHYFGAQQTSLDTQFTLSLAAISDTGANIAAGVSVGEQAAQTARLMAMLWAGFADSVIGCWDAKFSFSFWRPVTAIRAGGGNPALTGDPSWTPLGVTPSHPEYPAAHGCVTGAVSTILASYFGTPNLQFSVDSTVTNTVHDFNSTHDLIAEVENARIYAGFHYHHSVVQGKVLGTKVAHQLAQQFFQPVR